MEPGTLKLSLRPSNTYHLSDTFWSPRLDALRRVTLPGQVLAMEETGRIDNFRGAAGEIDAPHRGFVFNDSDVYKWLEAAARAGPDPAYAQTVETLVRLIPAAQAADGYLNTAFMGERASARWTNLRDDHELYCAGHFIEAALALADAGDRRLLAPARRLADLVCRLFGPEESGRRPGVPGHEEIEIALLALYRATREQTYLDQARYFLDARGRGLIGGGAYHQDHKPFRELETMQGHAVRALYLNIAAADLYLETGEPALLETLVRLWERLYGRQAYVTGGLGARHAGESFGEDYELPNESAYSETCAAVAAVLWNQRMLQITGEARYTDALETALYNAALAGISLAGDRYFYTNPLASEGTHRRAAYFSCACCPPNIARLLAMVPGLVLSGGGGAAWVHLYAAGEGEIDLDGQAVRLRVETGYPWDGEVRVRVLTPGKFGLRLRVPGWAGAARVAINRGRARRADPGYVAVERRWSEGDVVRLSLPFEPVWLRAHPAVGANAGRAALRRGPLVYCVESDDPHPEYLRIAIERSARPVLLGGPEGLVGLEYSARRVDPDPAWDRALYLPANRSEPQGRPVTVTSIPYFAWANGDPKPMRVWLQR